MKADGQMTPSMNRSSPCDVTHSNILILSPNHIKLHFLIHINIPIWYVYLIIHNFPGNILKNWRYPRNYFRVRSIMFWMRNSGAAPSPSELEASCQHRSVQHISRCIQWIDVIFPAKEEWYNVDIVAKNQHRKLCILLASRQRTCWHIAPEATPASPTTTSLLTPQSTQSAAWNVSYQFAYYIHISAYCTQG